MVSIPLSTEALKTSRNGCEQPLPVRRRMDLTVAPAGNGNWTVKDPITQQFYHLRAEEYFLWQQLDGQQSWTSLVTRFERQFHPLKLDRADVLKFIQQLWQQGLILLDAPLSAETIGQFDRQSLPGMWTWLSNPLAIRLRGVNPQAFLKETLPLTAWLFSPLCILAVLLALLVTLPAVLAELPLLNRELQLTGQHLGSSVPLILLALMVVKILHELGHGYACVRQGGECRELGLMFLLGTPCLYCNVSDAWLFPSRWQRAAVGAAGIYVELFLATLASWIWLGSVDGIVHDVARNIMLIGSLNTLLLNGNPLLRYDGYYVLSDLLNVPNLRSRSQLAVQQFLTRTLLGTQPVSRNSFSRPARVMLVGYGLLSTAYTVLVLVSIATLIYVWLIAWNLGALAVVAGGGLLLSAAGRSSRKALTVWWQAGVTNSGWMPRAHWWLGTLLVPLLLMVLCLLPLPRNALLPALIVPRQVEAIVVTTPGILNPVEMTLSLSNVAAGDKILRLTNHEVERQQIDLRHRLKRQQRRLELLEQRLARESNLSAQVSLTEATVRELQELLDHQQQQSESLHLRARNSGMLVYQHAELDTAADTSHPDRLMNGVPQNVGSLWLSARTEVAQVISPERTAILYVPQSQLSEIVEGMPVRVSTPQVPGQLLPGRVASIAAIPTASPPRQLVAQADLPLRATGSGVRFASPVHEVRILLEKSEAESALLSGQLGTARIDLEPRPLWQQSLQFLQQTFPIFN